jgi:hypothetical protein
MVTEKMIKAGEKYILEEGYDMCLGTLEHSHGISIEGIYEAMDRAKPSPWKPFHRDSIQRFQKMVVRHRKHKIPFIIECRADCELVYHITRRPFFMMPTDLYEGMEIPE